MTYKDKQSINKLSRLISKWSKDNLSDKDTNKGLTDNMSNIELAISNLTDTISTIKLYK